MVALTESCVPVSHFKHQPIRLRSATEGIVVWPPRAQEPAPPIAGESYYPKETSRESRRTAAARQAAQTREEKRHRTALRMCERAGLDMTGRYIDYRYWQAKRCMFNPDHDPTWDWWAALHWQHREECVALSRLVRWL